MTRGARVRWPSRCAGLSGVAKAIPTPSGEKIALMYNERRRDPRPRPAVCLRCGWSGTPDSAVLRDTAGSPSLLLSSKLCPQCGGTVIQLGDDRPGPVVEVVTQIREANLDTDQLSELLQRLASTGSDASPRQLAEGLPWASKVVTAASRLGKDWQFILTTILTVISLALGAVEISDAEQGHADADRAHHDGLLAHRDAVEANRAARAVRRQDRTGGLTQEQELMILRQIDKQLAKR
jgi:hypothetical protein